MAKDRFYPKKPHVNASPDNGLVVNRANDLARMALAETGMSQNGMHQFLNGENIGNPDDRTLLAELVIRSFQPGHR